MHTPSRLTPLSKALLLRQAAFGLALTLPFAAQVHAQEVETESETQAQTQAGKETPATLNLAPTNINSQVLGTTTENTGSYTTGALTIGKGAHSLRETPQSVSIVTRKFMDDKNITTLDQALSKAPGISFTQRNFGSHQFMSRGFTLGEESFLMDGVSGQTYNLTGWMPLDMADYDRVEVLRGSAGLLVGAGSPGGAVNLVRKRPTAEPQFSITTRAGSWDTYRMDLDGSGRLNEQGTLRGRVVAAYEDKGSYIDAQETQTPLLSAIVEADLSDSTTLAASVRRQRSNMNGYSIYDLPRYSNGSGLDISRSTSLSQKWAYKDVEMDQAFIELSHRFNDNWTSKTTIAHTEATMDSAVPYAQGTINPVTQAGSTYRQVEFRDVSSKGNGFDTFLEGNFDAFGLTHQVTLGANWSKQTASTKRATNGTYFGRPINIFDVNNNAFDKPSQPAWSQIFEYTEERKGLYANTRLHLAEPLTLVLGTRVSWFEYDYNDKLANSNDYVNKQTREVTPFAGLIYDIDENWSWYASYSDIFKPQANNRTASGSPLDPAIGSNYETGIKGELFDKQLNVSMALFYIKQKDIAAIDTSVGPICVGSDASNNCYLNDVVQRSKGVDLEASGEVLPGLQVMGGYTFNMLDNSSDSTVLVDTPKHIARLSTMYTLPGEWNQVSMGVGVSSQSRIENRINGVDVNLGGRTIWDARIGYQIDKHWNIAVNGENLFDHRYYAAGTALDRGNIFGAPRSYMLTLRGDF